MRKIFLFSVLALLACNRPVQDSAAENSQEGLPQPVEAESNAPTYIIKPGEGFGAITAASDRAQLAEAYGPRRILEQDFYIGEGYSEPGLAIFPGTSEEVEVLLKKGGGLVLARISHPESSWQTEDGLRMGTTLQELEALNGAPFEFTGLDWDYGGRVTDWKEGKFPAGFLVTFDWQAPIQGNQVEGLPLGDGIFSSADYPHLQLNVVSIGQNFN
jgi:hypothetical protein